MKPNGKKFAVRAVLFAMCAVFLLSDLSNAETVRGTFKLPVAAHWGKMALAPGKYEFVVDTSSTTRLVTIRSKDTGFAGMTLAASTRDVGSASGASLALAKSEDGVYVQTLYLNDAGVALYFMTPKSSISKLAKASAMSSSASGTN